MSHRTQRSEKNCLNCGTEVAGKYCQNCGQENVNPQTSVGHFITHFFNDVTHFDGKFFKTLKDLLFKPGFLSKEFMEGRRMKYLDPVRMYLFTSFIFFLIFFSTVHFNPGDSTIMGLTTEQINKMPEKDFEELTKELNNGEKMTKEEFLKKQELIIFEDSRDSLFTTKLQYDSLVSVGKIKDGWIQRWIQHKKFEIREKYGSDGKRFLKDIIESFLHSFPQILFVSLPLVALLLKLQYIRRKQFYYVSHAVFTLHFYIFFFIMMLLSMGVGGLFSGTLSNILRVCITILIGFYLYKAMRKFYRQNRFKTVLKYFLFLMGFFLIIVFLFAVFLIKSIAVA